MDRGRHAAIAPSLDTEGGCVPQLLLGNAGDVATKVDVILERCPGYGIVTLAETEKAAEADHGVGHAATNVVDEQMINVTDPCAIGGVDVRAFDILAGDQSMVWVNGRLGHADLLG